MAVFNLLGQKVVTLIKQTREGGAFAVHVQWNGRDKDGRSLATGVYFYRLQAGAQHVETRKLLLLR